MSINFNNLDLFSVGITVAATGILGSAVFFHNSKNSTNRAFFLFSLTTIGWGVTNYLEYQSVNPTVIIWLLRGVLFWAIWQAFFLYRLFSAFPEENKPLTFWEKRFLIPLAGIVSLVTLTPFTVNHLEVVSLDGGASQAANGPGMALFGLTAVGLVLFGIYALWKKLRLATDSVLKSQIRWIFLGASLTFLCVIIFNFIYPAILGNARFIPLGSVFFFPFIIFTFYAITRHGLFSARIAATEILTFVLALVSFFEVVMAEGISTTIFRSVVFTLVLFFGILLIRSVLKEVRQREVLQALTVKLQDSNSQLEQLSHFKTQLLSLASHQIKAPIAAIKGFATLLRDGLYGPIGDKQKETSEKIRKSSDELIALINNLLDLRKVEEGKMEYKFTPEDICEMTRSIVEGLNPLAQERNISLGCACPVKSIMVSADKEKLTQVIRNLTDNAIKYTPKDGSVHVDVVESKEEVTITVSDTGVGIPADLIPYLFEEFVRDDRIKSKIRGTGLGLYIARKIVEEHKGRIWVESPGDGKGSSFHVVLSKI